MEFGFDKQQKQSDLGFINQDQDNLDNLTISVQEETRRSVGSSQLIRKCPHSHCSQIFSGPSSKSTLRSHIFQQHFDTRISRDFGAFAETFKRKRIELGYSQRGVVQGIKKMFGSNCSRTTLTNFEHLKLPYKSMAKLETTLRRWLNDVENENVSTRHAANVETIPKCKTRKKMRKRTMFNAQQRGILENAFLQARKLSLGEMTMLAQKLGLDKKVVRTWFCNRRYQGLKPWTGGVKKRVFNKPRRTFTPEFKQLVFEAFNHDTECIGNTLTTAKKFDIDYRQVQNWTQKLANSYPLLTISQVSSESDDEQNSSGEPSPEIPEIPETMVFPSTSKIQTCDFATQEPAFINVDFENENSTISTSSNTTETTAPPKRAIKKRIFVKRTRFNAEQRGILENAFLQTPKLGLMSRDELTLLAQKLVLEKKVVITWFHNSSRRSHKPWTLINAAKKPRRSFTPEFKQMVFEAFNQNPECIGNYRATAKKFGIQQSQVLNWTQQLANSPGNPSGIRQISSESVDQNSSGQTSQEIPEFLPETMVFPSTSKIQTCNFATQEPAFINVDFENENSTISTSSNTTETTAPPKPAIKKRILAKRTRFNAEQRGILENVFLQTPKLRLMRKGELSLLAQSLGLEKNVVRNWFSHRRNQKSKINESNRRRSYKPEFKQSVFEAFNHDPECIGNYLATAKKFGLDSQQVQIWIQKIANGQVSSESNDDQNSPSSAAGETSPEIPETMVSPSKIQTCDFAIQEPAFINVDEHFLKIISTFSLATSTTMTNQEENLENLENFENSAPFESQI